nr:hypothetical protein [Tanacetum cinerariifolium]
MDVVNHVMDIIVNHCQPDNQNVNFSDSNQIQTPQYLEDNPPSPEKSNEEIFQAKGDLMKSIQTFFERFNCIPFKEKPQILFQTWETFFSIQCSQLEDSNDLFQKLLKGLKELAEYDQSTSTDRPIFLNDNEDHPVQNKESPENSSEETVVSKTNQEPPQDSDIHQLIEECSVEVSEQQKQKMEDTMFDLVKICHHKYNTPCFRVIDFLYMYDDVDNLIESALDSKLLSINSINSQRLDKKEHEVKIVVEQPAKRENLALVQSTKEPEHLLSMGYEHPSITPETKSDEVTESNAENLLPVPSKCEEEIRLIENLFYDNSFPRPPEELNAEIAYTIIDSIPLPIPVQDGNSQQEEIDIVTETDDVLPPGIENFADDPEGDIHFLEELLIDDSILSHESFDSSFEDSPLIPRPPPEPPDVETDAGEEIPVVMNDKDEDVDCSSFIFVIYLEMFPFLLSAESEDTIFDPECSIEVPEEQKQKMENTMFELVKICQEKQFLCMYDDVDNLIESALDSKLLSINSINSQRLDKKEQEVKNVLEHPAKRENRNIQSLQNFRVVHKSSISFKNTSQISSIHAVAPVQSTKEPEHLLSMGYEHPKITPETESDEVTESNAENLLPIPSKCEVTLEDEIKCDMPANDVCSPVFTTFSNPLFKDNDDLDSRNEESLPNEDVPAKEFKIYSNHLFDEDEINSDKLDPHCFNVEYDFVESLLNHDTFIDFSSKIDFSGDLAHIKPEIPKSDFDFEEEIRLIENLLYDNSFPRPPKELNAEITYTIIVSIPLPIPVQDDGDIRFLEELLIDDSILSHESFDSSFEDSPLIPQPSPEPPDVETDAGEEIPVVMNDKDEDIDCSSFIFVIYPEMFPFLLSAESEDTIFDPVCKSPIEIVIFQLLSLRTIKFRDRVELTTRFAILSLNLFVEIPSG